MPPIAFTAFLPSLSTAPASPSTSISPTHAICVLGEWMPKKSVMPSQMEEIHPDTLSQSHPASDWMPSHKPRTRFAPTSATCDTPSPSAFTMPVIICGIARTISAIICGRLVMRAVKSFTPVSMIFGILFTRALITAVIICGSACTIVKMICGRLVISAVKSFTPASTISGKWSRSVAIVLSMICGKTSHIVVMISGRFSTRAVKSSTPVSMI